MKCNDIQEYFIDYLEGDMGETKRKEIENHLIECESCKEEMKVLQQIVAGIESESDLIQVPDGFMNKVSRKVSNTQESFS
ncbi:zf-HC2 domain-containing protein [Peribacillus butanolivorans]|uniref:anti-sigma factor family protein n=1 Tax=Peribacillus butanolivorans TaxID=421767 RepID=UPI002E24F17C|nr:zf-HC2 domain-containing protein [Peribacillus butanolivorans]